MNMSINMVSGWVVLEREVWEVFDGCLCMLREKRGGLVFGIK